MQRVCIIDVPGLSRSLLNAIPANSRLGKWLASQRILDLTPSWPAVTCSVQATLTTGVSPARHGIIANGIATYRSPQDQGLIDPGNFANFRREVSFWEQSNQLVEAPRFWQGRLKTALLFFQNAMPGFVEPFKPAADIVITPKPEHGPSGTITSLCWSSPRELIDEISSELGPFPLIKYWGPLAGIESSQWIARASAKVWVDYSPQLQLVYIPHLDYDLQRFGPSSAQAQRAVADMSGALEPLMDEVLSDPQSRVVLLSEYAMNDVKHFAQPNVMLADAGLLVTRDMPDGKLVDYDRSAAFAMVDHQIAHVYVRDRCEEVRQILQSDSSIDLLDPAKALPHRRSGDLLLEAVSDAWFDYRWWNNPSDAPSFAKEVDIHRKPGYDPCELFFDPETRGINQDPTQIRGSHGAVAAGEAILAGAVPAENGRRALRAEEVAGLIAQILAE